MKAHQLSGSKIETGAQCLYWARPEVVHPYRPMSKAASKGVKVHKAAERYVKELPHQQMDPGSESLWSTLKRYLEQRGFDHSEVALLYNAELDIAKACETGEGERDYLGVCKDSLPMRLDLVRFDGVDLTVVDIKTGSKPNTEPARTNLQLATQAVAASRFYGVKSVTVGLAFPMKTKLHEDYWVLGEEDLDSHAGKLRRMLRTIPEAQPIKGDKCRRCPIGPDRNYPSTCPAWA